MCGCLRFQKLNILCLQDTHWTEKIDRLLKQEWEGDILYSGFKSNARGVAILLKQNFECTILDQYSDNSGNLIVVDLKIHNNTFNGLYYRAQCVTGCDAQV